MHSTGPQALTRRLVISFSAVALCTAIAPTASAQAIPGLFNHVETLRLSDGTPVGIPNTSDKDKSARYVSLSADTAVVAGDEVVHVFEREAGGDHWVHSATLVASDGISGFGSTWVATDGTTIVVGAGRSPDNGAAYVFQRIPGSRAWQETAKLTGDVNASGFGASVAVSGTTIVVGAPPTDATNYNVGAGLVYVFERGDEPNAWEEVARLVGEPPPVGFQTDYFGAGVDVEGDMLVVSASRPENPRALLGGLIVYVFARVRGDSTPWTLATRLSADFSNVGFETSGPLSVDISGDVIVAQISGSGSPNLTFVFQQNGSTNEWDQIARFSNWAARVSGDLMVVDTVGSSPPNPPRTRVYARKQNGGDLLPGLSGAAPDRWGEVARFNPSPPVGASIAAISQDTILTGFVSRPLEVYVADTDRDGLRDGIDACPRDPLNNVAGGCTRNSAAYLALDDLIALGDVAAETQRDEFHVTATFINTSDTPIGNAFFEVTELTGGNLLMNADAGPGGTGATLTPDVGDGILSPGESTTVRFVIGLETHEAFRFFVSVRGEVAP